MSFSNPINIATASVECIYERLCWLYASFRSTFVYNANGQSYPLSDITQLSRAKIPFPERFDEMIDYQQNAFIQGLLMKDVLCTRQDWASIGRHYYAVPEYYAEQGQKLFVRMEGAPLREPEIIAKQIILQLNNFPIYFLGASSTTVR